MIKELCNIATAGLSMSESRMLGNALKMKTKDLDIFPDDLYNAECFMAVIYVAVESLIHRMSLVNSRI